MGSGALGTEFLRCGSVFDVPPLEMRPQSDCTVSWTRIDTAYDPGPTHDIPVVFHVLRALNGTGEVSDSRINLQIAVLNQTFASAGITFTLQSILRHDNDAWFNDGGQYWDSIAVDPSNFLNIYSNNLLQFNLLGYVPYFPQEGIVGQPFDRIVLEHTVVGNGPFPFNLGFTATHEVGHYLGLYHPFTGGCTALSDCNSFGDLICDTPAQRMIFGCPGNPPICFGAPLLNNFMGFTDDPCMSAFTAEQINRMRCTLESWRAELFTLRPACSAVARPRNLGANADVLRANPPVLGQSLTFELLDHSQSAAVVMGRIGGAERDLTGGQVLMLDMSSSLLFRRNIPAEEGKVHIAIPMSPSLCGLQFVSQAVLLGTGRPFSLTNAIDMTVGL